MRIGLLEMKHFCQEFFVDVKEESFLQESAGVSDVITSCLSGRNYKVAAAFVGANKVRLAGKSLEEREGVCADIWFRKSFDQLEAEMLNGQSES